MCFPIRLRDGPLVFLRGEGGWAISKNYSCTRTLKTDEKESCKESHGGKLSSIFYYPGAVFDFEKEFSHKLLRTNKNHVQPKDEKNIHAPGNCPPPPPSPFPLPLPPSPLPPPSCPSKNYWSVSNYLRSWFCKQLLRLWYVY